MLGPISLETAQSSSVLTYSNVQSSYSASSAGQHASAPSGAPGTDGMGALVGEVQNAVDGLLEQFGSDLTSDQQLRLIIALLILNALLGRNQDEPASRMTELAGLAATMDGLQQKGDLATFSATNIIQIQHQSTLVYTDTAIQTPTETGAGGGERLDVSV